MDGFSSDKAFNYSNGIVDKEEATYIRVTDEEMATNDSVVKVQIRSKQETDFFFAKEFHQTIKETSREFSSVATQVDFKTVKAPVHSSLYTLAPSKDMSCKVTCGSINQFKPCMRKKIIQKEMAFDRECKKLETVWGNRGLPVDKKTLRSAARKDAFDMSDLSESLPSTSASKKNLSVIQLRRRVERPCMTEELARCKRLAEFGSLSSSSSSKVSTKESTIVTNDGAGSSEFEKLRRITIKSALQRLCFKEREAQKKVSEKNSDKEKGIQNGTHEEAGHHSPDFEKMSLDDKQEEKGGERQNPVAANIPECICLPLCRLHRKAGKFFDWPSERIWKTEYHAPDLRVPANSPVKNEGMADNNEGMKALLAKKLLEMRTTSFQLSRYKLGALGSHRGVCSKNMDDGSEIRKPSSEQGSNLNRLGSQQNVEALYDLQMKRRRLVCKEMLVHLRESVKNIRYFPSPFSHGSVKSDKVVPD